MFGKLSLPQGLLFAGGAAALAAVVTPAKAQNIHDLDNEFCHIPFPILTIPSESFSGWDNFEIVLAGNQTALPALQNPNDNSTNPYWANGTTTISARYDSGTNSTTVEFKGNGTPDNQNLPQSPAGTAHFGLTGANNAPLFILRKYWTGEVIDNASKAVVGLFQSSVPAVNVVPSVPMPAPGQSVEYELIFVQYSQDGIVGGQWSEIPFVAGQNPTFEFTSGSADPADPITFSNAGFLISPTEIPLDNLNSEFEPPPGSPGSSFTPMPDPPPITSPTTPEPSSLVLLSAGTGAFLIRRRKTQ